MIDIPKIDAKKSLGQHFLNSEIVPEWMCNAADLSPEETVLEIGPGTGMLTRALLKRGARVLALETDIRAVETLSKTFADACHLGALTIIHADVRSYDFASLPQLTRGKYAVVANIPYYLSGFLFRTFLESAVQPHTLVYLVQKEVAKRVCGNISKGEKESLLSLSVQAYGTPHYVRTVSRGHFSPPPKVDSAIVAVRNISKHNFTQVDEKLFFHILHLGFAQKRKQLLGNLARVYDRDILTHIFSTAGIPVSTRSEDVALEKWLKLVQEINKQCNT